MRAALVDMLRAMTTKGPSLTVERVLAPADDEGPEVAMLTLRSGRRVRVTLHTEAGPEQAAVVGLRAHYRHMAARDGWIDELLVIPSVLSDRPALFTNHVAVTGLDAAVIRQALIALAGA